MKRWLFALPLSVLCVFALFSVMAALVTPADNQTKAGNSPVSLDVLVTPEESEANRRERAAPPKPPVALAPPSLALSTPSTTLPTLLLPHLCPISLWMLPLKAFRRHAFVW